MALANALELDSVAVQKEAVAGLMDTQIEAAYWQPVVYRTVAVMMLVKKSVLQIQVEGATEVVSAQYRSFHVKPLHDPLCACLCMYSARNNSRRYRENSKSDIGFEALGGGWCRNRNCRRRVTFWIGST